MKPKIMTASQKHTASRCLHVSLFIPWKVDYQAQKLLPNNATADERCVRVFLNVCCQMYTKTNKTRISSQSIRGHMHFPTLFSHLTHTLNRTLHSDLGLWARRNVLNHKSLTSYDRMYIDHDTSNVVSE